MTPVPIGCTLVDPSTERPLIDAMAHALFAPLLAHAPEVLLPALTDAMRQAMPHALTAIRVGTWNAMRRDATKGLKC